MEPELSFEHLIKILNMRRNKVCSTSSAQIFLSEIKNLEDVSGEELAQGAPTPPNPQVERFIAWIQNLWIALTFFLLKWSLQTCLVTGDIPRIGE